MKKTKSNNNEIFTGVRRLSKLSDNKSQKKYSKKSSKKTSKKNKLDNETADMLKIINSESSNEQVYNQMNYHNKQKQQNFKDVDMTLVNDFVPVDNNGQVIVKNRIADLFGPVQQLNTNIPQIPQISNNIISEADMNMFNNTMNQSSLEMQVQQLNNMMGMQNQMPMMGMQNQVPMMGMQNQVPMMGMQNQVPMMGMQNQMSTLSPMMDMQNQMATLSPMMGMQNQMSTLSPINTNMGNMGNNLSNLANIYNIPKLI